MATSGSYNFSLTGDVLITDSLIDAGVIAIGETPEADVVNFARRKLNMLLKSMQVEGLKLWKHREITLFLQDGTNTYTIGPSGSECTLSSEIIKTETRVVAVATDTTIEVDSTTGMAASDRIGIELDDGTMHWTTISSVTDSDTLVVTDAIESGDTVAVDNDVWTYTNKVQRPLEIFDLFIRDKNNEDTGISQIASQGYYNFGDKTSEGVVAQATITPLLTNIQMKVYPTPSDSLYRLIGTARYPIEDIDSTSDDFDIPQEWFLPVQLGLAIHLTPAASTETAEFKKLVTLYTQALENASGWDLEQNTSMKFSPSNRGR